MVAADPIMGSFIDCGTAVGLARMRSVDSVSDAISAITWPLAGMFSLLPTAMIVAARSSCV